MTEAARARSRRLATIAAAMLAVPMLPAAQAPFRSAALGVRVDVLATEGRRPVTGLDAGDFELRDEGVVQRIELVDTSAEPVNVVLALDTSASTTGQRQADLTAATLGLLDALRPGDRAGLLTFSHVIPERPVLTTDLTHVRDALRRVKPAGRTSIADAVYVALTATLAQPGRSLVVVCTDGSDVSSWLRPDDVVASAARASAVVYAVASADSPHVAALRAYPAATGGDTLEVASSADLRPAFRHILDEFRSRYVLAFSPTGVSPAGFHRLEVRVRRRGVKVTARPGYVGLESPR